MGSNEYTIPYHCKKSLCSLDGHIGLSSISCLWQRTEIVDPQCCFILFPLVRHDCWSPWVRKFRRQSFGRQLLIWHPDLLVQGMWFLVTLPLPPTHLEPQQDRPTGKSLKIWRNWRPRLLKTNRFDGPINKSNCSQKPSAFPRQSPFYPTTYVTTRHCQICIGWSK